MAYQDLVGLLTGTPTQPIRPVSSDPYQRLAQRSREGVETIASGGRGVAKLFGKLGGFEIPPTPEEALQAELSGLDLNNMEDMKKLVGVVSRFDPLRAAQMADRIKAQESAMAQKQELEDQEMADRVSFSEYIRNKFPAQPALIQLAESGQLNASNFKDFLNDPKSSGFLKGTTFTVEDEEGNGFTMTPAFNKSTGNIENKYSPIGTKGPNKPVGKTKVTGGEFSLTAEEETARRVSQKRKEKQEMTYAELKVQAIDSISTLSASKVDLEQAETLLNSIETGGPINIAATALEGFFGVKSADKGQLEIILGLNMMTALKPLFGGLISNQEAERLDAIYAGMSKGNPANKGILRQLKKAIDDSLFKAGLYQKAKTSEDFNQLIEQMYPEEPTTKEQAINWGDL
jgi:hypothetical protein